MPRLLLGDPFRSSSKHRRAGWERFCLGCGVIFTALVVANVARADVTLSPSTDGYLGAWLIAGPVPRRGIIFDPSALRPSAGEHLAVPLQWLGWSMTDGGTGALDLDQALGVTKGNRAFLAGVLDLAEPLDGWLLLSVDGAVDVSVDGKVVWHRAKPHSRGNSWDPISLVLEKGPHTLALDLGRYVNPWRLEARICTKATLAPPHGAVFRLPGATTDDGARLEGALARVEVPTGVQADGYHPRIRVDFPRGGLVDPSMHALASLFSRGAPVAPSFDLGPLPIASVDDGLLETTLPSVAPSAGAPPAALDEVRVRVGSKERSFELRLPTDVPSVLARATTLLTKIRRGPNPTLSDPEIVLATLEDSVAEVSRESDRSEPAAVAHAARLTALMDSLDAGKDPIREPGVLALARRSRLDGKPQPLRLHVPAGYQPGTKRLFPLVVVLHGYRSNPERTMAAFLGTDSTRPVPAVDGFVLAPHGHGDAFYRGPGDTDVMDTLAWVLATYPIDPRRVSITGISMGGTGAAHFALRYPGRFSAAAALAGYQSYFVRRDVLGRRLRPWERTELARFSPASWAENGRDLFLYVAQGTRDLPLVHSTSLTDRYKALGYPLEDKWPDIGHDVWRIVWGNALMWPILSPRRIPTAPSHVLFRTDSLRYGKSYWVEITALERADLIAEIDARVTAPDRISVTTRGVQAFELERPLPHVSADAAVTVHVDGANLMFTGSAPFVAHRDGTTWVEGALPPDDHVVKRAGLEGPIRDAYAGPLAFVYGTLDPRQTRAAREVAEHWKARWSGNADFPVIADSDVTDNLIRSHSLFLVGSKDSNRLIRDLDPFLPLGIDGQQVRAGTGRITGDTELGFACVYPNPENPTRYVVLVEGADVRGLWRSLSLPSQLPDFIVFDSTLSPAAGQQVLGEARVLGAGYFDRRWELPASFGDPAWPQAKVALSPSRAMSGPASEPRTPASSRKAPRPSDAAIRPGEALRP